MELIKKIRKIRREAFGISEDSINCAMILHAYKKYGLFWKPEFEIQFILNKSPLIIKLDKNVYI